MPRSAVQHRERWKADDVPEDELASKYSMKIPPQTDPRLARPSTFRRSLTLLCLYDALYIIIKAIISVDKAFFSLDFRMVQSFALVYIVYGASKSWAWDEKRSPNSTRYLHKAWFKTLVDTYGSPGIAWRGLEQVHQLAQGLMFDLVRLSLYL